MPVILTVKEVEQQSNEVFGQFGEKWKKYARINVRLPHESSEALMNCGVGKYMVCAAMGESLEEKIEVLRKYRYKYDIVTCDKGFGVLMENGIKPDFVMICDSNIPFRWLEKYIDDTEGIKLLCTPYANIEWTTVWKGKRYYYVSKDAIQTEAIFQEIFGEETRIIPASSNVSNAMLVYFLTLDGSQPINWGAYERYFLVGYDYGWRPTGKYYAFSDPKPKRYYMSHRTMLDINHDPFFSSENLIFSAKWMYSYLSVFKSPVMNCSNRGILDITRYADLEKELSRINSDRRLQAEIKNRFQKVEDSNTLYKMAFNSFNELKKNLILKREVLV